MEPALRLSEPDPQHVFPWAEPGSQRLLAVMPEDVTRWRVKTDIKRIGWIALHEEWSRDGRWQDLMARITAEGRVSVPATVGGLLMLVYELIRNDQAMGLQRLGTRPLVNASRTWGLSESATSDLMYVADRAVSSGVMCLVDADDFAGHSRWPAYDRPRETARSGAEPRETARSGAEPRETARSGVKRRGVDSTGLDVDQTRPDKTGRTGDGEEITGSAAATATEPAISEATTQNPIQAATRIGEWTIRLRQARGRSPWPRNVKDMTDLRCMSQAAVRSGTLDRLCADLREVLAWADGGAGVREAMRQRGWL